MSGVSIVKVSATCPHCEVRKHQIDFSEEHATQVVGDAIEKHITEAHPEHVIPPERTVERKED